MSVSVPYPAQLDFRGDLRVARWRPLAQWLLAIPHLLVADVLGRLRSVLTLISVFTVLFTRRIPRSIFDAIAMTLRYEWRVTSYALFLREAYPPFDLQPSSRDDGADAHTTVAFAYPEELSRWKPLVKWLLAVPQYLVLLALAVGAVLVVLVGFVAVLFTGAYPRRFRDFLVDAYRYKLRVQAYVGLLTDRYPPFTLGAVGGS